MLRAFEWGWFSALAGRWVTGSISGVETAGTRFRVKKLRFEPFLLHTRLFYFDFSEINDCL
jgi:hypothetical protein